MTNGKVLTGRKRLFSDAETITAANVVEVLNKALGDHESNRADIDYLWDYYRGRQPVLEREKEIRPEICNKIVENRANEIVSFKVGYLMGEPVQYVNRGSNTEAGDAINRLNEYVYAENKAAEDKKLADWFTICGTAYRLILPAKETDPESPFHIYTLDPRTTFIVYYSGLGNRPLMAVRYVQRDDLNIIYSVYTENAYYEILDDKIIKAETQYYGGVPIIEYPANEARLGAFEIVLPLLDAINEIASNRLDGIEQFIQAFIAFFGVDIDDDTFKKLKDLGALKIPEGGDVKYLVQELNQSQTQTLKDDLYQTILTICGMPNRNGGTSTSDTGSAVIMRDGWSAAEARAKDAELMFVRAERQFLKLALHMADVLGGITLKLSDIGIRFTRRNYENIQEKSQVLTTMLANPKIHRKLAFEHCGMFADPDLAYTMSEEQYQEELSRMEKELTAENEGKDEDDEEDVPAD